jgi:hypothetical protein
VAQGEPIDTAAAGVHPFTIASADAVGNSSSSTVNYVVGYKVCLLYDPGVAKKSGSAYPIKLQVCDAGDRNVSAASIVLHATGVVRTGTATAVVLDDTGSANPDSDFRYDAVLGGYVFNVSTKGFTKGTYTLSFIAGSDPAVHSVTFAVK